jgi:hypothetical protein
LNLNHPYTPTELAEINQMLVDCLASSEVNESDLTILIEQRAKLVNKLLNSFNEPQRRLFAKQEASINQQLIERVTELRTSAKQALSSVAKSSKAIKQYQQV